MFIPAKPHAITKNKFSWALFFISSDIFIIAVITHIVKIGKKINRSHSVSASIAKDFFSI